MSILSAFKNIRRRAVESALQTAGMSEVTVDKEFDLMNASVKELLGDMNECGGALTSVLKNQKIMFGEARELTNVVHAMYERCLNEKELWPEDSHRMNHGQAASLWKEKWDQLHDVTRSSAAIVCCDEALDPIKETINTCSPTLEQDCRDRSAILKDFDSFRRRLKALEAKRDSFAGAQTVASFDTEQEIAKYQNKVEAAAKEYDLINEKLKENMVATKRTHDDLVETMLITFVTAQVHLFTRVAKELDEILRFFPAAQVREIRSRIDAYEDAGGIEAVFKEKSNARKVFEVAVGKSTLSDLRSEAEGPAQVEATSVVAVQAEKGGASGAMQGDKATVTTLYAYKSTDKDEISFEKGVVLEVSDWSDAGWWRGRVMGSKGKEGIFPSNYVTPIDRVMGEVRNKSPVKTRNGATVGAAGTGRASGSGSGFASASASVSSNPPVLATAKASPAPAPAAASNNFPRPVASAVRAAPPSSTAPRAAPPSSTSARPPRPVGPAKKMALSLFAYEAQDSDELGFGKGVQIEVLDDSEEWWSGKLNGKTGIFPSNYVKLM